MNSENFRLPPLLIHLILSFFLLFSHEFYSKDYSLKSPNGKIEVKVSAADTLEWSVLFNNSELIKPGTIFLNLSNGIHPGINPVVENVKENFADETIYAVVAVKNSQIRNVYNELILECKDNYNIGFRAYDDGAAYKFETDFGNDIKVISEHADFNFVPDAGVFFPVETSKNFISHYERSYLDTLLSAIPDSHYCSLPALVYSGRNKVLITEADVFDYPNMFLFGTGGPSLTADFPKVILEAEFTSDRDERIIRQADYIASTSGKRTFPWRVVIVTENDKELLESEMVFKLSPLQHFKDTGWIIPGRVAWDWWNALNIYGVSFPAGINTSTYKYYIDFASRFGLEYIILDEGWSLTTLDLLHTIPEIDLPEIINYGKQKNVGVILWVLWGSLNKDMENILDTFQSWGVKGIKVDFMQRADQDMVNFYEKCALQAAKRHLAVDYHGAYKPSGLNRKYPNVLSFEGVKGLEWSKWSSHITPRHDVTLPFIRMAAGPMDFTPGAMRNASEENFFPVFSEPMSQGTRCHQAAMYVVYTSPLQMFSDSPSNYLTDTLYTHFISRIPTTWDETIGLDSKTGEYVSVARRKNQTWYIGAMTDWNSRELELPLDFLDEGSYTLEFLQDGINASRHAADYKPGKQTVKSSDKIKIALAPGGGWVGIISK